ncbi:MAG: hypothetical protein RLZZ458_1476 [Planctomycetota bacterium]
MVRAANPVFCGCGAFGDELLSELAEFGVGLGVEELYLVWCEWWSVVDVDACGADEECFSGECVAGAGDADGVDGLIGSACEGEESGSEAEEFVGVGASAFGEDTDEEALVEPFESSADAAGAGCFAADGDDKVFAEKCAEEWDAEEIVAGEEADGSGEKCGGNERVEE